MVCQNLSQIDPLKQQRNRDKFDGPIKESNGPRFYCGLINITIEAYKINE